MGFEMVDFMKDVERSKELIDKVSDLCYGLDATEAGSVASALYIGSELFGMESVSDYKLGDDAVVSETIEGLARPGGAVSSILTGRKERPDESREFAVPQGGGSRFRKLGTVLGALGQEDLGGLASYLWYRKVVGADYHDREEAERYGDLAARAMEEGRILGLFRDAW